MKVITLCGSTRFRKEFEDINAKLTLEGNVVLSVGLFGKTIHDHDKDNNIPILDIQKELLDKIHKHKIKISDSVFVINKNGYIGESTNSEIEYAIKLGKEVIYLEKNTCKHLYYNPELVCLVNTTKKITDVCYNEHCELEK